MKRVQAVSLSMYAAPLKAGHAPPHERASRAALEMPRKQAIAGRAAELVEDGMVVFLDAGTTCQSVVPFLTGRKDLTVVTNHFHAVPALRTA
ncbi:hypothetical protein OH768_12865 [Streptomyces sp. NBC_01622]|uniref:hypothetical protein n=1 Tax=Streptomyces sp. NBC_01622 TaxID=2975903 RepID=UPI00386ACB14|nr:hypothetical protein OH768_12865 [Streptomyces sp. NBC_01622]